MELNIKAEEFNRLIRGKNINFLIGAGASSPIYPTLSFGYEYPSFEDIVSNQNLSFYSKTFMYMYYLENWLKPMSVGREDFYNNIENNEDYKNVIKNYERFINVLYNFLQCESNELPKRINIFTTNYDLIFERTFDEFLLKNPLIYFNDGSRGFFRKYISNKNYYLNVTHSGYNDNYRREVPTINLFKLHGSLSWESIDNKNIEVIEYNNTITLLDKIMDDVGIYLKDIKDIINNSKDTNLNNFVKNLNSNVKIFFDNNFLLDDDLLNQFNNKYNELIIINPNKYKFSKTVSEQHYYQLIRAFSYELEKKQTILIVFGFSFADEHIKDIFERSLLNPELQVIIITYSLYDQNKLKSFFKGYKNIIFLPEFSSDEAGDFNFLLDLLGDENE